ncbi:MAG: hypothetical protein WC758_07495 [Candidatus Woesearchaeota archaeon]|jgi:hypothetical protein
MESTIKYCKDLVRHGKVVQISKTMFNVEDHSVKLQKRNGATLLICDCLNEVYNSNSPAFCLHKFAVITYLANRDFIERLDKLIEQYKLFSKQKLNVSQECFIDDLNSIKEKW